MNTGKEIITKFHSIGDAELSLADTQWLIQNIDKAINSTKQAGQVEPEVILPKPNPQVFTLADLEKAYNDGYKNGIMNEAGLECEPFSVWYNWVHIIKSKNRSEA